jgi:predicted RNase H-like HicB family nuclease
MTRKYSLVIEGDNAGSYSAYVPEVPTILITGASVEELSSRASEAIRIYWDSLQIPGHPVRFSRD